MERINLKVEVVYFETKEFQKILRIQNDFVKHLRDLELKTSIFRTQVKHKSQNQILLIVKVSIFSHSQK